MPPSHPTSDTATQKLTNELLEIIKANLEVDDDDEDDYCDLAKLLSECAEKHYRDREEEEQWAQETVKRKTRTLRKERKEQGKTTGKTGPNSYSKFVRLVAGICQSDPGTLLNAEWNKDYTDITFTPAPPTGDKAKARWDSAAELRIHPTEISIENLIRIVKNHPPFSNLMIASSLVWNMIPSSTKQQVTDLAVKYHLSHPKE
jgi:hypothetical protein